jgi:hypothetical protein
MSRIANVSPFPRRPIAELPTPVPPSPERASWPRRQAKLRDRPPAGARLGGHFVASVLQIISLAGDIARLSLRFRTQPPRWSSAGDFFSSRVCIAAHPKILRNVSNVTLGDRQRTQLGGAATRKGAAVENLSRRTTASLFVAFILLGLSYGVCLAEFAGLGAPAVHCDHHLRFTFCGPAYRSLISN